MEILVRQDFSPQEIKRAEVARDEFKRNRFTTGSAHLDDLVTLGKAVILCDPHARKFNAKTSKYERHPAPNLRKVWGNCDLCNTPGLNTLFVNCAEAVEHRRSWERARTAMEYGTIISN